MTSRQKIKAAILKSLLMMDGEPMPEGALDSAAQEMLYPHPTLGDVIVARKELESEGFITGTTGVFAVIFWTLKPKGKLEAQQL